MTDKNLHSENRAKKAEEVMNTESIKRLLREIEKLRDEINKTIARGGKEICDGELLKLSRKLDELVIRYLIEEQKKLYKDSMGGCHGQRK